MNDLWNDPPETTRREFRHGPWAGWATRANHNSNPHFRGCKMCPGCGYRMDAHDFHYNGSRGNDHCWNCWMIDSKPEEVRKIWDRFDNVPVKKDQPKMERL